jgi:hypothetical protein
MKNNDLKSTIHNQSAKRILAPFTARAALAAAVCLLTACVARADVTIYSDTFARSGGLNGTQLGVAGGFTGTGGYGGNSSATWSAEGSIATDGSQANSPYGPARNAFLPFTPEAGHVYTFTLQLDTHGTDANWAAFGFVTASSPSLTAVFYDNVVIKPVAWMLQRADRTSVDYIDKGPGIVALKAIGNSAAGYNTLSWVLDTTAGLNAMTAQFYRGAVATGALITYTSNPGIKYIGFGGNQTAFSVSNLNLRLRTADAANSTVTANPTTIASDGISTSTITVTLKDASSNPAPGKTVTLASSRGAADTISAASGVSSASGVVTFTVKSSTSGPAIFTATDVTDSNLVISPSTATVTFEAGAVSAANSTVAADPSPVTANGSATSTITVTLKDIASTPIAGKTVTLASNRGATDTISAASGASDTNGVVTFTVTSTTVGAPVFTATDTTDSIVLASTATVTFTAGAVNAGTSTVAAAPTSVQADGSTTSTITVTLKDAYNNPVAGKTVTLVSSRVAEDTISAASGTSSVSGVVTFTVTSTTAGSSVFTATGDGVLLTPTATVTFGPSAAASTVAASPTSVTADGSTTSTITVTLKDAGNQPVTNKTVTLAKTSGPGTPVITTVSGTTDTNGVATFTVTSTTAGADVFTATDTTDGVTVTPTATVTFTAGAVSAGTSTVAASPTSVTADGVTPSTITVTLKDGNNNPVSGKTVSLAHTSGPGSPVITTNSNVTDASGHATFTVTSTTLAADVFTATDVTDGFDITLTATVTFMVDKTIYSDTFARSGGLNGTRLGVAGGFTGTGGYGGNSSATWSAEGSIATDGSQANSPYGPARNAFLPFTPEAGYVYTFTLQVDTHGNDGNWAAFGFVTASSPSSTAVFYQNVVNPFAWMLQRANRTSGDLIFQGPGTLGSSQNIGNSAAGYNTLSWVLDTTAGLNAMTAQFYRGAVATGTPFTYTSNPGIRYIGFGGDQTAFSVSNLSLTARPAAPAASYDTWAAAQTPPLTGGPSAVGPDGLPNLLVYALALKTDGTNGSPGTLTGNQLSFTKRPEAVANGDVTYAIEVSADLGVNDLWHTTTTGVTNNDSTISIDLSTLGGNTHFARLVVTQK